jgi:superfamily I DNA/RNA helicase
MDGVEVARRIAAELHKKATDKGWDPSKPYEFAVSEANRRGIDVEPTAAGAAMLNGGRAALLSGNLILHEKTGSSFEDAFLVAHELGHVELGDDNPLQQTSSVDIDPTRPLEPTPIGLDRVVGYGRRQRREVQMDLFAREFLLPRDLMRTLHIDQGLSASAIVANFAAPFEVVAQQMLDALLLPPIEPEDERREKEREPNPEQAAAASYRGKAFLLEAGPGTGKTQTLVARVESLLEDGVDPRKILLLTFSNKAAAEMADRIAQKAPEAAAAMWIGTFHAFGLDFVRRFHQELGLPADPRMMDMTEAVELLEEEFPRIGLVHYQDLYDPTQIISDMLRAISRAKDEVVGPERYAELAADMEKSADAAVRLAGQKAGEVAKVYSVYEALKRRERRVDFGDLVSLPVQLLESNAEIKAFLRTQYDHVLVDEYQDVNRSSVRLLEALRGDGENLWVVGDGKQSIYRFRGASSFNMRRIGKEDFSGARRERLEKNYRSVTEIVDLFSEFATQMIVAGAGSGLKAERGPSGDVPELRIAKGAPDQTVAVADAIEEMRRSGYTYRQQAVLCTGNEKLSDTAQELERLGIPVLFIGNLFERQEIKDLLSILTILSDRWAMGLVRTACMPEFPMSMNEAALVCGHLRSNSGQPAEWLQSVGSIPGLEAASRASLEALAQALNGFDAKSAPWPVLATLLLDRTRIAARIHTSTLVSEGAQGIAIWQFMNFLRAQPAGKGLPIPRLLERVKRLVRLGDDRDLRQLPVAAQGIDAVRLMTIHGAKGLEFPVIHVPGMNVNTLPRTVQLPACPPPDGMIQGETGSAADAFKAGQDEEQECLFYVAVSRARDRLLFYAASETVDGKERKTSVFLDRLGSGLKRGNVRPSRSLPPAAEVLPVPLDIAGGLRFTGHQLDLYRSCPRRFFYTYVLQIGGRRTTTPFMQMHEAVRDVVKGVIATGEVSPSSEDLHKWLDEAFIAHGLVGSGYAEEFKTYATALISFFNSTRGGMKPEKAEAISVSFGGEEIIVLPDDVLLRSNGERTLRRVQTGKARGKIDDDLGLAAFVLAARKAFPGASVEIVHLADNSLEKFQLTKAKLTNREVKIRDFLAEIRAGRFPAKRSSFTCPRCPAYFICGPTPAGKLKKSFA